MAIPICIGYVLVVAIMLLHAGVKFYRYSYMYETRGCSRGSHMHICYMYYCWRHLPITSAQVPGSTQFSVKMAAAAVLAFQDVLRKLLQFYICIGRLISALL